MTNIQPDTSLYSTFPDKLRAMLLIEESVEKDVQFSTQNGDWTNAGTDVDLINRVHMLILGNNYRLKPAPRELWVVYRADGKSTGSMESKDIFALPVWDNARPRNAPHSVVRFVEAT